MYSLWVTISQGGTPLPSLGSEEGRAQGSPPEPEAGMSSQAENTQRFRQRKRGTELGTQLGPWWPQGHPCLRLPTRLLTCAPRGHRGPSWAPRLQGQDPGEGAMSSSHGEKHRWWNRGAKNRNEHKDRKLDKTGGLDSCK